MLSYAKRAKSRTTVTYSKLKDLWNKSELNSVENFGNTGYLIRECIENLKSKNVTSIKRADWAQYYLKSGQLRKKNASSMPGISNNVYYGRTLDDLYSLGEKFLVEVKESLSELKVDEKVILNFIYSEIVDNAFRVYVLISKINIELKEKHPNFTFEISGPHDFLNNGIDILTYKNGIEAGAIKLLPNNKTEDSLSDLERQKHKLFSECNFMPVMYLTLDYSGELVGDISLL